MEFGKLSVILTEDQEKNLNKLDWFLVVSDKEIDKVNSFFERLELLDETKKDTHKEYKELILFKINQVYHLIISMEQNIYNSSFDYYEQYFGLYKNKNKLLEMKEMTISYQFEGFLAQLKSLIDFFLKYIWEIRLTTKISRIDSFEYITREIEELSLNKYRTEGYKRAKSKIRTLKREKILDDFFKNYEAFYNLKNYRDYIIHRGRIKQDKSVSQADRYIQFNYYIPQITFTNKNYSINEGNQYRLDFFCRIRFLELIHIIWKTLDKLIEQEPLKKAKEEIKNVDKEEVKEVLNYLGRKLIWNDRSFMKKEDVENFLKKINLTFSDLIVEEITQERQMKGSKSVSGKDMSYLLERTRYKPLNGLQFQKIKYIYDRDWKPPEEDEDTYGFGRASFTLGDIHLPKEKTQRILESFIKLGIVIKVHENDEIRYDFIDDELRYFISTLLDLSQYKWSFIKHPQMQYFRKRKEEETSRTKKILNEGADTYLHKEDKEREDIQLRYNKYKERQKEWKKFKKENNLDVRNFKKNSLDYRQIANTFGSGLYKEIREKWNQEYSEEGHFDIVNKDNTQILERVCLLEYIHEINTNFKHWKKIFKGKKFQKVKKSAQKIFHRRKEHWLDIQKRLLEKSKKRYILMLEEERKRYLKIRKKYTYLNQVLKLINKDFFSKKPDLD